MSLATHALSTLSKSCLYTLLPLSLCILFFSAFLLSYFFLSCKLHTWDLHRIY
jgi:hypothetical protein